MGSLQNLVPRQDREKIRLFAAIGSCALCAQVALEECELPYSCEYVELRSASSLLLFYNPLAKVPTLVLDTGEVMTQSAVILPYIADQNTRRTLLAPHGTIERRRTLSWLTFYISDVHPALKMIVGADKFCTSPGSLRESFQKILRGYMEIVNSALVASEWLTGSSMTVADIYAGAMAGWLQQYGLDLSQYTNIVRMAKTFDARTSVRVARAAEKTALWRVS